MSEDKFPSPDSLSEEISAICGETFQRDDPDGRIGRAFHKKTHALLTARLEVFGNLPASAASGFFERPAVYDAWGAFLVESFRRGLVGGRARLGR